MGGNMVYGHEIVYTCRHVNSKLDFCCEFCFN